MRTPAAQRVLVAAVGMLERHHAGMTVHPVSLEWARFTVNANDGRALRASDFDDDQPTRLVRPAGTWERSKVASLFKPAHPFDGLAA